MALHGADADVSELGQAPLPRKDRVGGVVAVLQQCFERGQCRPHDGRIATHVAEILPALVRGLAKALCFPLGVPKLASSRDYGDRRVVVSNSCLQDKKLRKGVVGQVQEQRTVQTLTDHGKVIDVELMTSGGFCS